MYDLDTNTLIECANLPRLKEIHDKIITVTTVILNAFLLTKDKKIKELNNVLIINNK